MFARHPVFSEFLGSATFVAARFLGFEESGLAKILSQASLNCSQSCLSSL